ncbi:SRPBCC family protein [Phocaeicola sp.]
MAQFESSVKFVPYSQERVFNKLSDLSNLESVRDKLADKVQGLAFDSDTMSFTVQGVSITLRIIEREPYKCIKFESEKSPVPMNLWIQILPVDTEQAKLKVTIRAEVNMFMRAMVAKPLQDGVDKLAEMLSVIPY